MEVVGRILGRLYRWQYLGIALILATSLLLHVSIVQQPDTPMFDEQYYVKDARAVAEGTGELRREHPPAGQLLIASGIILFGDNPIGWRFFSVLFGVAGILLFYLICDALHMPRRAVLIASFLLAFEVLTFVQASVAMLDVFSVTLMLAAFWLYLRGRYVLSATAVALSTLAKLTGGLALVVIGLHWLLTRRDRPTTFCMSAIVAPLLFVATLPAFDYLVLGEAVKPIGRIQDMLGTSAGLTFASTSHPYASRPWEWVLGPEMMPYWWDPQHMALISFTVGAVIVPVMCYMGYLAARHGNVATFAVAWFAGTFLIWIPLVLVTDRVTYIYYFYPAVGAVCLGLGYTLDRVLTTCRASAAAWLRSSALLMTLAYLALHLAILVALTPLCSRWISLYVVSPPA